METASSQEHKQEQRKTWVGRTRRGNKDKIEKKSNCTWKMQTEVQDMLMKKMSCYANVTVIAEHMYLNFRREKNI